MNNSRFLSGMGAGLLVGSALGMLLSPRSRCGNGKSMMGRCLRSMGNIIDDVSDAFK